MKQFDLYEFAGILVPGIILIAGSITVIPQSYVAILLNGITSAIFALAIGFGLGHLVQGIGNFVEWCFWKPFRGRPTDWLRLRNQKSFSSAWRSKIFAYFHLDPEIEPEPKEWDACVRLIIEAVNGSGNSNRLLVFNGNYGLFRGMATVFLVLISINMLFGNLNLIGIIALLGLAVLSFYRMYRFAVYYAKTLFATFINIHQLMKEESQ